MNIIKSKVSGRFSVTFGWDELAVLERVSKGEDFGISNAVDRAYEKIAQSDGINPVPVELGGTLVYRIQRRFEESEQKGELSRFRP